MKLKSFYMDTKFLHGHDKNIVKYDHIEAVLGTTNPPAYVEVCDSLLCTQYELKYPLRRSSVLSWKDGKLVTNTPTGVYCIPCRE